MLNQVGMASHHVLDKNYYMKTDVALAGVAHSPGPAGSAPARPPGCRT